MKVGSRKRAGEAATAQIAGAIAREEVAGLATMFWGRVAALTLLALWVLLTLPFERSQLYLLAIIVFALAASAFATPAIIGGRRLKVASTLAYDEFLNTLNWPLGAAVAVLLLVALVAIVVGSSRLIERRYAQVFG